MEHFECFFTAVVLLFFRFVPSSYNADETLSHTIAFPDILPCMMPLYPLFSFSLCSRRSNQLILLRADVPLRIKTREKATNAKTFSVFSPISTSYSL